MCTYWWKTGKPQPIVPRTMGLSYIFTWIKHAGGKAALVLDFDVEEVRRDILPEPLEADERGVGRQG